MPTEEDPLNPLSQIEARPNNAQEQVGSIDSKPGQENLVITAETITADNFEKAYNQGGFEACLSWYEKQLDSDKESGKLERPQRLILRYYCEVSPNKDRAMEILLLSHKLQAFEGREAKFKQFFPDLSQQDLKALDEKREVLKASDLKRINNEQLENKEKPKKPSQKFNDYLLTKNFQEASTCLIDMIRPGGEGYKYYTNPARNLVDADNEPTEVYVKMIGDRFAELKRALRTAGQEDLLPGIALTMTQANIGLCNEYIIKLADEAQLENVRESLGLSE